ncbi:transcriptional repressor LexA [Saccharicrinis sp. FJH62]|uniref:transcriptional repressor LexA n=1 Tax=Saccharicrinis sp. FJH62 TaxID=3344657 RepID=UPI0035D438BA
MFLELSNKETALLEAIRSYLMLYGKMPSTRSLMRDLGYKSPRSVTVLLQQLTEKGALTRKGDGSLALEDFTFEDQGDRALTAKVPLLGSVACGLPMLAEENVEAQISVSVDLIEKDKRYFFLRASGDSMNQKGIDDGDLVLIRQDHSANSGDLVVALIDDDATIKQLQLDQDHIVLRPCSDNPVHQPIILTRNFRVQGVVVSVIKVS